MWIVPKSSAQAIKPVKYQMAGICMTLAMSSAIGNTRWIGTHHQGCLPRHDKKAAIVPVPRTRVSTVEVVEKTVFPIRMAILVRTNPRIWLMSAIVAGCFRLGILLSVRLRTYAIKTSAIRRTRLLPEGQVCR